MLQSNLNPPISDRGMKAIAIISSITHNDSDHYLEKQSKLSLEANQTKAYSVRFTEPITYVAIKVQHRYPNSELNLRKLRDIAQDELKKIIIRLQQNLEQSIAMVQEQEDELLLKRYYVRKLQRKVNIANNIERFAWETQLKDAEEQRNLLNETLIGQRRNITKKTAILLQYQQLLKERQSC